MPQAGYNDPPMSSPSIKILLQTTIPTTQDDWSIARFSKLTQLLREQRRAEDRDPGTSTQSNAWGRPKGEPRVCAHPLGCGVYAPSNSKAPQGRQPRGRT